MYKKTTVKMFHNTSTYIYFLNGMLEIIYSCESKSFGSESGNFLKLDNKLKCYENWIDIIIKF